MATRLVTPLGSGAALHGEQGGTGLNVQELTPGQMLIVASDSQGFTTTDQPVIPTTNSDTVDVITDYTVLVTDGMVRADASVEGFAFDVTLPPAALMTGLTVNCKKLDNSGVAVNLVADGAETIDGGSQVVMTIQYANVAVRSNGISWDRI